MATNRERWQTRLAETREWYANNPDQHPAHDTRLGQWVTNQRSALKRDELSTERVTDLEAIEGWQWQQNAKWEQRLTEIREWYAANPDQHPPSGTRLGQWVTNQTSALKRGKLSTERVTDLEAIEGWQWRLDQWQTRLTETREWYAANPGQHPKWRTPLGRWVSTRRSTYNRGQLAAERIADLEAIPGWQWEVTVSWDQRLTEIREWYANNPGQHPQWSTSLGQWVTKQRSSYDRGILKPERATALEATPGWQWRLNKWQTRLTEIREWYANYPDRHPPQNTPLGRWVAKQRFTYNKGELSAERIGDLATVNGWQWTANQKQHDDDLQERVAIAADPKATVEQLDRAIAEEKSAVRPPFRPAHLSRPLESGSLLLPQGTRRNRC